MATIQEKIKGKKIVSFKIKVCVGRDENGKQVFRCKTWYPPEELTNGKARKEVQKVAILWEDEAKTAYIKEQKENKPVAGLSRSFTFEKFVYEVWVPLCVRDGSHRPSTIAMYTNILKIIVPQFEGMSIKEISGVHISQYEKADVENYFVLVESHDTFKQLEAIEEQGKQSETICWYE